MSIYGSSPYNITGLIFTSQRGQDGPQGPRGPTGSTGNPGYGPTGPSGYGITSINFNNQLVNTVYSDGTVRASDNIDLVYGNYYIELTGATSGRFSPLQSTELVSNITETIDGENLQFPIVRRLNFKNIKTNSSPFVTFDYDYAPSSPQGEPGQVIELDYSVFNLSASIVGGGSTNSLLINLPGDVQSGYTGTTYNVPENAANFGILNAAEQLKIVNKQNIVANTVSAWVIDPSQASIFYLKGFNLLTDSGSGYVNGHHILIKKNTASNIQNAFTIIFPKEFYSSGNSSNRIFYSTYSLESDIDSANFVNTAFSQKFEPNIIWQSDSYFCPSQDKYDVVNFIGIGSRYIGIPAHYSNTTNTEATIQDIPTFNCKSPNLSLFYQSTFNPTYGVCCKTDCTCSLEYDFDCSGYFYEGITCGGSTGICSNLGACCLFSTENNIVVPCQELTFCNCATIASQSNLSYNWQPFTNIKKSCLDFDCNNSKSGIGACCGGDGFCNETTQAACESINGFYQGAGVKCVTNDNLNVCVSGNGACCDSGITCSAGITGEVCLSQFKTYFGDGTTCGDFICAAKEIPCYGIVENELLTSGAIYEGGIVVGIFNPNRSECFGPSIFDGNTNTYSTLTGTTLAGCTLYYSNYDYSGYGFNQSSVCDSDQDTYLLIVSPHPISINANKNIVDGESTTNKFIWSNGSVAWGPLVDLSNNTVDEFDINNLSLKEGYIYSTTNEESSKLSLYPNTFLTCDSARFDTVALTHIENKPTQSITGQWTRNYGLYNTIRLIGGEYFYYNIGTSQDGATMANYTPTTSSITAARALSIYNIQKPTNYSSASKWYIPSIDELSYIAHKCSSLSEFNLNSRLLELGYTPFYDWYWSSTGALNITNNEGILTPAGITHGSEAWAIKFDVDGKTENMVTSRKSRTNQYYVRPVKLIRCDKRKATVLDDNFKIWYVPNLSENIIDNS